MATNVRIETGAWSALARKIASLAALAGRSSTKQRRTLAERGSC
jgi:hypothetical protein